MFENSIYLLYMVILITALVTIDTVCIKMAKGHLKRWAAQKHIELQKCEYRHIKIGPYHRKQFFVMKGGFRFFRIEAKTAESTIQTGWVRVGDYFFGPLSGEVDVIWD